jgi:hypothetical protein
MIELRHSGDCLVASAFAANGKRAFQALALWLGLVALTIQGLVPLCIATPAAAAGGSSIVICTVHGYETVQLDANGNPTGGPVSDHGTGCFLCLGCQMGLGLPAPALAQFSVPSEAQREPMQFASALAPSRPQHLFYVSRAPPTARESLTA